MTEIAVFVLVAVVCLDQPHCEALKSHVRVSMFLYMLHPWLRAVVNLFDYFIALLTVTIIVYAAGENALFAYRMKEALAGIVPLSIYLVKFVIVIGFIFYWIQLLLNLREEFGKLRKRNY